MSNLPSNPLLVLLEAAFKTPLQEHRGRKRAAPSPEPSLKQPQMHKHAFSHVQSSAKTAENHVSSSEEFDEFDETVDKDYVDDSYKYKKYSTSEEEALLRLADEALQQEIELTSGPRQRKNAERFYANARALIKYKSEHGGCADVPQKYPQNKSLGIWVNKQRQLKRKWELDDSSSKITARRFEFLDRIGFKWCTPKGEVNWEGHFQTFCRFYEKYGHGFVKTKSQKHPAFSRWVSTQRSNYKKRQNGERSIMTDEQETKLTLANFVWDASLEQGDKLSSELSTQGQDSFSE